jgi:hypothetical protein
LFSLAVCFSLASPQKKQATLSFGMKGQMMGLSTPKASDSFHDHGHFLHGIYPDRSFLAADSTSRPTAPLKIASFDMDWTLIRTKTGNTFPKGKDDWLMLYDDDKPGATAKKLQSLHKDGFQIVVFTNQAGVAIGRQKVRGRTTTVRATTVYLSYMTCFIIYGEQGRRERVTEVFRPRI